MTRLAAYVGAAATAAAVVVVVVASVVTHYRFRRRNASVSADGQETLAQDEAQASARARSEPVPLLHPWEAVA